MQHTDKLCDGLATDGHVLDKSVRWSLTLTAQTYARHSKDSKVHSGPVHL